LEHYDCVVIGAGPAGLAAARALAEGGFRAVVLEKGEPGGGKACGGAVPAGIVPWLEERFGPLPEDLASEAIRLEGLRVVRQGKGAFDLPYRPHRLALPLPRLGRWLASACGIPVTEGAEVVDLEAERFANRLEAKVAGADLELSATFVISADGGASPSLQRLRPEFSRLYQRPSLVRVMDLLFPLEAGVGGWRGLLLLERPRVALRVYPSREGLHLAVPARREGEWEALLQAALPLLRRHFAPETGEPSCRRTGEFNRMGMRGFFSPGLGSVLLAGEAAGLLDPWGDGIELALFSGYTAGKAAVDSAGERVLPYRYYAAQLQGLLERLEAGRRGNSPAGDLFLRGGPLDTDKAGGRRRYRRLLRRMAGD